MSGDELFSADPEKILKRAMSDVRFARSGYEAGHLNQALLLMIRGLEKLFLYHLMVRNIPYSRDNSSLNELLKHLSDTSFHTPDRERLCRQLDVFQFERRDEVMDIIKSDDQYMTLSELDEEDVEEQRAEHMEELEDEVLEDWQRGEWGPDGWTSREAADEKDDDLNVEGEGPPSMDGERPDEGTDAGRGAGESSSEDDGRIEYDLDEEDLPAPDELYKQSITMFKALYDLVNSGGGDG